MSQSTRISEDEYIVHREEYDGFCLSCNDWTAMGGIEPDARDYECTSCGKHQLFGAEEILMMGILDITDEDSYYLD